MANLKSGKVVFMSSTSPWSPSDPSACMDSLLTFAVFDIPATLVLHGEGVLQVVKNQNGSILGLKTLAKTFGALGLYGIDEVMVEARALQHYGLSMHDLLDAADMETADQPLRFTSITPAQLASLIADSKAVFNF